VLEARHAFGIINAIRLPMGLFTFLGPVVVVLYGSTRLDVVTGILAAGRIVACAVHSWYAWRVLPDDHGRFTFRKTLLRHLCVSGGWLTVSNVISPLMSYGDRFVVGILLSSTAVAYYATPQEMVSKLGIIPGALTAALFPRFSAHFAKPQSDFKSTYYRSVFTLAVILFFPVITLSFWAKDILSVWISPDFASQSAPLLVVLSWGMFAACLATIPFTVIQSAGNARLTALFHILQFPVFMGMLYGLIGLYGVIGAAFAWAFRNLIDAALLFYSAKFYLGNPRTKHT
jgi:O-antigen/teichoic acid export membrane protein